MTVEIVRIHPTEAKKMRRLHRHWSPGTDVPAGLGAQERWASSHRRSTGSSGMHWLRRLMG
ncbi:hypothetical protein GCM10020255_001730 [Rhodococcus baikonurensis]